ncbi:unnamed protein product [Ixodes persulcatus]
MWARHRWLLYNSTDPKGQLHWLVDELQRAEDAGDKVFILGHVAPVHLECITAWANSFRRIANRYESTIVAHFYGHTHFDHFHLFYDEKDESRPTGVAYMGPSVTTFVETNPSYRVYTVDGAGDKASWEVVDHETYWMDLAATNRDDKPRWALQYAAKKHYGLKSLSPRHWHELAERFNKDDNLFQDYYRFMHKLFKPKECAKKCKLQEICSIQSVTSKGLYACMESKGLKMT